MARNRDVSRGQGTDPSMIAGEREIAEELRESMDYDAEFDAAEALDMTEEEVEEFFDGDCTDA